jgi:hypothetical protein
MKWEEEFEGMVDENMSERFCMLMDLEVEKCVPAVKASGCYCPKWINIKKLQSTFKRSCYRPCSHRSKTAKIKRERERGRERDSGNSSSYQAYNTIA